MDTVAEFGFDATANSTKFVAKDSSLLNLFASFVGKDVNDLLSEPKLLNRYDDMVTDDYEWNCQLKMASSVLLNAFDNINFTDNTGQTFLHHFIEIFLNESCNLTTDRLAIGLKIIEDLLDRGASIFLNDNWGVSPFKSIFILDNRQPQLKQLISTRFKICLCNIQNCRERKIIDTIHLNFGIVNFLQKLEMFLENGFDFVQDAGTYGTLIMTVCEYYEYSAELFWNSLPSEHASRKIKIISLLVEKGCNVNAVDSDGYSALHYAIEKQNYELVKKLIELGADTNQLMLDQCTPLCLALQMYNSIYNLEKLKIPNLNKIGVLPKTAADVNAEIAKIINPFYKENICNTKIILRLIKNDADINVRTECGLTPLHLASMRCNVQIVETLIERGADVNCREPSYGLTPLHLLSMNNQQNDEYLSRTIESLIKNGADVNVRDSCGMTPLHYATLQSPQQLRPYDALPKLLSLGANVNQRADDGQLPLSNVIQKRNISALGYLLRFGADLNEIDAKRSAEPWIPFPHYQRSVRLLDTQCQDSQAYHYVTKLNIAGLPTLDFSSFDKINNNNQQIIRNHPKYLGEVKKLKNYYIEDRISLYDWLHMNYTKARPFYLSGMPLELESEFPVYYEVIQARYHMVKERIPLLEPAKLAWYRITKINLPDICVEWILFYLSNSHLRLLVDCSE